MILPKSIATLVRALHRRKGRREHNAFLVEGERALGEVAGSAAAVHFAFAYDQRVAELHDYFPDAPVYTIDKRSDALFATDNPQGIAAVLGIPEKPSLQTLAMRDAPILVLDGIADPGNMGTIVRSAEWFGIGGLILLPGCADPFNPKSVRASMGSVVRVTIVEATVDELLAIDRPLYALDANATHVIGSQRLPKHASYVIGSEAHGVSDDVARESIGLAIQGRGSIESLNAAIAAAILCYELTRVDE